MKTWRAMSWLVGPWVLALQIGCAAPGASENIGGLSEVSVAFGEGAPVYLTSEPVLGLLEDSFFLRVSDGATTVFVGVPRRLAENGVVAIGTRAGAEATVWASSREEQSLPLIANRGELLIRAFDTRPGGRVDVEIVDASRSADGVGPGLLVEGVLVVTSSRE